MLEKLYFWPWGQKSRSYIGHECMQYILSYWYTHMLDMVCIRQRTKKLWPRHELTHADGQTDRQSTWHIVAWWCIHVPNIGCLWQRTKKLWPGHETDIFYLEVKGQGHTEVINIRDTSSHSDTPICQIWYAYLKEQSSYGPDTNLHRQTDGQSDSYIPPQTCLQGV